jgi:multimeric flavodoxin WrbA
MEYMQEVYQYLEVCDNVIIASPIWFSSLGGPTLNIVSRIHTIYEGECFCKQNVILTEKKGTIIIVGAEPGTENIPTKIALTMMKL